MSKTLQELLADRDSIAKAMLLPGVPPNRMAIYEKTIATIDRLIAEKQAEKKQAIQTEQPQPREQKATTPPITVEWGRPENKPTRQSAPTADIKSDEPPMTRILREQREQLQSAAKSGTQNVPDSEMAGIVVQTVHYGQRRVTITWTDDRPAETLTEGEAKGEFTTRLRDLARSLEGMHPDRYADLTMLTGFGRAVGYYRALAFFAGFYPTPLDLRIAPLSRAKDTVFSMVRDAAIAQTPKT